MINREIPMGIVSIAQTSTVFLPKEELNHQSSAQLSSSKKEAVFPLAKICHVYII